MDKNKGVFELIFKILDMMVGSEDSKVFKVSLALVIVVGVFMIYKGHIVKDYFVETKYETYLDNEAIRSEANLPNVVNQALQIAKLSSGADLVYFNRYSPPETKYFYDIYSYEGTFPTNVFYEDIANKNPINKTTKEYNLHLGGLPYTGTGSNQAFIPFDVDGTMTTFSCPVFDLENAYAGSIVMIWYGTEELEVNITALDKQNNREKLFSICNHGSRIIGRSMK